MNHDFQHADLCPNMRYAFAGSEGADVNEEQALTKAATHLDTVCGILKRAYAVGRLASYDYEEVLEHLENAEDLLEEVGILDDHDYIEDLHERAVELYDVSDVDADDSADDHEHTDRFLFGDHHSSPFDD